MSVVTPNELWEFLTSMRRDILNAMPKVQDGFVVGLTGQGEPIIRFIGESEPSQKRYPRYKSYIPAVGDRVQLINGVVIGGWKP